MEDRLRIVAIDNDCATLDILSQALEPEGYQVTSVSDGTTALDILEECKPHLVLLDSIGSDFDGLKILRFIRERWDVPVIMLGKDFDTVTLVKALTSGADDYLVEPYGKLELVARVRAKLRRAYKGCLNERFTNKNTVLVGMAAKGGI